MNSLDDKRMSCESALYLVHHIFLPSYLPQADDFTCEREVALLQCTHDALVKFSNIENETSRPAKMATAMMRAMIRIHKPLEKTTAIDEGELIKMLRHLRDVGKFSDKLATRILRLTEQYRGCDCFTR